VLINGIAQPGSAEHRHQAPGVAHEPGDRDHYPSIRKGYGQHGATR
jgi:hypothetical protein